MGSFQDASSFVFPEEGVFSDDPKDPGNWTGGSVGVGALKGTKYGISAKAFPWLDIVDLAQPEAAQLFKAKYWDIICGDQLPNGIAIAAFDCSINMGPRQTALFLQRAAGVPVDGIIGPNTLAAIQAMDQTVLINAFCDDRKNLYLTLPEFPEDGKGWLDRLAECRALALSKV